MTAMCKPTLKFLLLGSLFLWGCSPEQPPVETPPAPEIHLKNGQTVEEVTAMLGNPTGRAQTLESSCSFYRGGGLEFKDGLLTNLTPELEQNICAGAMESRRRAGLKKNLWTRWQAVLHEKREAKRTSNPLFGNPNKATKKYKGDRVHGALLAPEKVTVVYFYADWCPGCAMYSPHIAELVASYEGVVLRQVNVGPRDSSEVWTRYNLRGVPSVRVFDRKGCMVGGTVHRPEEVRAQIESATKVFGWDPFRKFRVLGGEISEFFSAAQ